MEIEGKSAMNVRKFLILGVIGVFLVPYCAVAQEQEPPAPQPAWAALSDSQRRDVFAFAEDYKDFMSRAKTEISFVVEAVAVARAAGFRELTANSNLRPGGRFYDINRDRAITLIVVGSNDFVDGFRVVGAHIDSPRLELKAGRFTRKKASRYFKPTAMVVSKTISGSTCHSHSLATWTRRTDPGSTYP